MKKNESLKRSKNCTIWTQACAVDKDDWIRRSRCRKKWKQNWIKNQKFSSLRYLFILFRSSTHYPLFIIHLVVCFVKITVFFLEKLTACLFVCLQHIQKVTSLSYMCAWKNLVSFWFIHFFCNNCCKFYNVMKNIFMTFVCRISKKLLILLLYMIFYRTHFND